MINGGLTPDSPARRPGVVLWKGHCLGSPAIPARARRQCPRQVSRHSRDRPSRMPWKSVRRADGIGSTEGLLKMIREAPRGTMFAVGTEIHLVNRMATGVRPPTAKRAHHPRRFRLPLHHHVPHIAAAPLLGAGESGGRNVVNQIKVKDDVKHWANSSAGSHAGHSVAVVSRQQTHVGAGVSPAPPSAFSEPMSCHPPESHPEARRILQSGEGSRVKRPNPGRASSPSRNYPQTTFEQRRPPARCLVPAELRRCSQ